MKKISVITLTLLVLLAGKATAQDVPEPMYPPRLVNDYTGILKEHEFLSLERKLEQFNDSTSTQVVVALVWSLNGLTKEEFADRIGQEWGVGQKGKNNGIVILIKPKINEERGEARISVGYGLEGVIPDAVARRIVGNEMIPSFKQGDYYTGIDRAVNTLIAISKGEFTAEAYQKKTEGSILGLIIPALVIVVIIIIMSRNSRRYYTTGSKGTSIWTAIWLASMMGNRGHGGSWGNFNSGGGSFGGGGGFGGFGGGSFGGGGAGGSW